MHCAFCKGEIGDSYFRIGGEVSCPNCGEQHLELQRPPQGWSVFLRVTVFGLLAATAGAVLGALLFSRVRVGETEVSNFLGRYGIVRVQNPLFWWFVEFSIPLATGFLVATAIRRATGGRSSRTCQFLAVLLTFGATVLCHSPLVLKFGMLIPTRYLLSVGNPAAPLWALLVDTLVLPWALFFNDPAFGFTVFGPSAVALPAVWRLTARDEALVAGPYSVSGSA